MESKSPLSIEDVDSAFFGDIPEGFEQVQQEEPVEPSDPIDDLPHDLRSDIDTIINRGYLLESFSFGGHRFTIKTLSAKDGWAASAATLPFAGSLREPHVFMAAIVGLALVELDGRPDFHIKLDDAVEHAKKRLDFIGDWDDVVIEYVFQRYNSLDQRRTRAREAIGNLLN